MHSDEELFATAMAGGPESFAPIVDRYRDAVFGVALARLGDFHEAEDAAQEVFIEAFQRLGNLRDPARLGAWLRSMTVHKSIDRLRRRRDVDDIREAAMAASDQPTPPEAAEKRELRDQVLDAIGRLSRKQRETAALFYINGYSVAEVASIQEVPAGTVKRRLHDAREHLKEEMIDMVETVLKREAPKEDFGQRVFELLSGQARVPSHQELVGELRRIGADGFEGFVKAASSPQWQTRRQTMKMLRTGAYDVEAVVRLLKSAAKDSNKKVRQHAAALFRLDVPDERKRREFLPIVLPLLADASARVRSNAAWALYHWPGDVPLAIAARAFLNETHPRVRPAMGHLLRRVLEVHEAKGKS